jgi:hypothetical protein
MSNIFEEYVINNEIFVDDVSWKEMQVLYPQGYIIQQISDSIELFKIKLPYRNITEEDVEKEFFELKKLNTSELIKNGQWFNKFDYNYAFQNKYIDLSNTGAKASDYFHQIERWKCDATGYPSPQKTWENEKFRLTLFKALFSLKVKEINPTVFRSIISLRKYIAAQFRPSAAKAIYDMFQPETVLDFSMGWGDRILGAYTSSSVKKYVGFDPNLNLLSGYVNQVKKYSSLSEEHKEFVFHPLPAETQFMQLDDKFDLIFTSPPYFDKEKYDQSEMQSYIRHKGFDAWLNDFLCKTIELRSENLKRGGFLVINISDIYTRKKLYKICDGMNSFIDSTNEFDYKGAIGLRMPKRPMSISSDTVGIFGEPIWIWQKN